MKIDNSYKHTTDSASFDYSIEFYDIGNGIKITRLWKLLGVVLLAIITNRDLLIK